MSTGKTWTPPVSPDAWLFTGWISGRRSGANWRIELFSPMDGESPALGNGPMPRANPGAIICKGSTLHPMRHLHLQLLACTGNSLSAPSPCRSTLLQTIQTEAFQSEGRKVRWSRANSENREVEQAGWISWGRLTLTVPLPEDHLPAAAGAGSEPRPRPRARFFMLPSKP